VNELTALLMACSNSQALNCLVALLLLGPLPVTTGQVQRKANIRDDEAARRGLVILYELGLASYTGPDRYRTNWRLTPAARRLAMDLLSLAQAIPADQALPLPLPLIADPAQDPLHADHRASLYASETGETSGEIPEKPESAKAPAFAGAGAGQPIPEKPESAADVVIVFKESHLTEAIKNNNNTSQPIPEKPESPRRTSRHVREVASALLTKGVPRSADDPFPPDLRACVERLVGAVGAPRRKAELTVAKSPWKAPTILEQIDLWLAYRASALGRNLDRGKFPWLVCARIESGDVCPADTREGDALSRYDGYAEYLEPTEGDPTT
jgi:hypothetical protein